MFYILFFSIGIGLILASYSVFFRDIIHLYSVALVAWNYLTPIIYPIEIVPDKYRFLIYLNPLHYIITCFRDIVLYSKIPSLNLNLICLILSVGSFGIGLWLFGKKQDKFILYV